MAIVLLNDDERILLRALRQMSQGLGRFPNVADINLPAYQSLIDKELAVVKDGRLELTLEGEMKARAQFSEAELSQQRASLRRG